MRLPIPIWAPGGTIYTEAELRKPTPNVIADTADALEKGLYRGVTAFLAGCVSSFSGSSGSTVSAEQVRDLVRSLPYQSTEALAIYALLEGDSDDGIEGVYDCPRCGRGRVVCEYISAEEDARDHVRDLPVACMADEDLARTVTLSLSEPYHLQRGKEGPTEVRSLVLRWPTLRDCISAEAQSPGSALRQQMVIYELAVETIGEETYTPGVLSTYAHAVVGGMSRADMRKLGDIMSRYGIRNTVKKTCPKCGKVWDATVATSNFFASALAS